MKAEHSGQNQSLSFSLEAATAPLVSGPSHFARALKQARFARGWTQADLAAHLSIPKRAIVSWETGERMPSIGMVVVLLGILSNQDQLSLHRDLITTYIVDDLERLRDRKGQQAKQDASLLQRIQGMIDEVLHLSKDTATTSSLEPQTREEQMPSHTNTSIPSQRASEQQALEPLLALITKFQQHPELIAVASDFIRELAPDE